MGAVEAETEHKMLGNTGPGSEPVPERCEGGDEGRGVGGLHRADENVKNRFRAEAWYTRAPIVPDRSNSPLEPLRLLDTGEPRQLETRSPDATKSRRARRFQRAGDRTRTGDVQLGKLAFYH